MFRNNVNFISSRKAGHLHYQKLQINVKINVQIKLISLLKGAQIVEKSEKNLYLKLKISLKNISFFATNIVCIRLICMELLFENHLKKIKILKKN